MADRPPIRADVSRLALKSLYAIAAIANAATRAMVSSKLLN
jgi:hypothetical protein